MKRDRYTGEASWILVDVEDAETQRTPIEIIRGVQSRFNLVFIEGLGEGKTRFDRDGSFSGTWAYSDTINDVNGRANGDQTTWTGRFEIRNVRTGKTIAQGSFRVKRVST